MKQNARSILISTPVGAGDGFEGAGGIGGLLARTDHSTLNPQLSTSFYHCDGNGNVTALVGGSQALARYLYDPFGNILSMSGPLAEANLYRFSSKEFHPSSGLVYFAYRLYEPSLQRWPNRDPIKELGHFVLRNRHSVQIGVKEQYLYAFVRNSPIDRVDAFGLKDRGYPLDGVVCNDCFQPEDFGTEVYVLINGQYSTLPPGQCTTSTPLSSDDVDGVWICGWAGCEFWNVQPSGPTNPFNACGKKPKNCQRWNNDPESGNSPRTRSGGKQNNSPPSPKPPVYRSAR